VGMGCGTLDKTYQEMMLKIDKLITEIEGSRKAIKELQDVIVKLDKQNRLLQIIGLVLTGVAVFDIIMRLIYR
jgi:hypothetical protein